MENFITVVGWLTTVAVVVAIAAAACTLVLAQTHNLVDKLKERGAEKTRLKLHQDLTSGAYWFSEHPPTYALLREYADRVVQSEWNSVQETREKWRGWMKDFHK